MEMTHLSSSLPGLFSQEKIIPFSEPFVIVLNKKINPQKLLQTFLEEALAKFEEVVACVTRGGRWGCEAVL